MDFLFNDLSLSGQFEDVTTFHRSLAKIMEMRRRIRQFNMELMCHRNTLSTKVTRYASFRQIINQMNRDQKRSILGWITKTGPFWDDDPLHRSDDYLEANDVVVTETAIAESACRCVLGLACQLVSMAPSEWEFSPVTVTCTESDGHSWRVSIENHIGISSVERQLRQNDAPPESWHEVADLVNRRFSALVFSDDAFAPLEGHPFVASGARRILQLLGVLDQMSQGRGASGAWSQDGQHLYQQYFVGQRAPFSDSSASEKHEFGMGLLFTHPANRKRQVLCSWHGKINTPVLRIHFGWPDDDCDSIYIVYVGPKITKR